MSIILDVEWFEEYLLGVFNLHKVNCTNEYMTLSVGFGWAWSHFCGYVY